MRKIRTFLTACAGIFWLGAGSAIAIDHNLDGVSDVWARYYEAEDLVPGEDSDGDGFTNLEESIAWTDPHSPKSRLRLEVLLDGNGIGLAWPEHEGVHYLVEASTDLTEWVSINSYQSELPHPTNLTGSVESMSPWAPYLGSILEFDPLWGLEHDFFGPNSEDPEYGILADPDFDGLTNLLECYGGTDPFVGGSNFQATLVGAGKHLRIQWNGSNGSLRYELEIPIEFEFLNEFDSAATNFLHYGSSLGDFFGAQPKHRTDPFQIRSYVTGETQTHGSPDFVEEDAAPPTVFMDQTYPVAYEEDHDGNAYFRWTGMDGFPYVVRMRIRLGDWYWGRMGSMVSFQPGPSKLSFLPSERGSARRPQPLISC